MPEVTWEYYSSLFTKVNEEEFSRLSQLAEMRVNLLTHNRAEEFMKAYNAETATGFQNTVYRAVILTICEVINKLHEQGSSAAGNGITSVSNDGYSETYSITTETEKQMEVDAVIRKGLSGTGLAGAL